MNKTKKRIAALVLLAALVVVFFLVYRHFSPRPQAGTKHVSVEVVDAEGASKVYETATDAEFLSGVMDELAASTDFSYEGTDSEYGLMITHVNGLRADYVEDGAYWAIYVNGAYGEYGADSQPVTDGDAYSFVYESAN
ncbi:MAG: DUF4430 domain-containing protein [Lachnospiraceae bacterium]|nr:DUF4430 domain-containing protein [Lachnospiraceae bacterium]